MNILEAGRSVLEKRWELREKIGSGIYTQVFIGIYNVAREIQTNLLVALKRLRTVSGSAYLKREAMFLSLLTPCICKHHLDVPKLVDSSYDSNSGYIVMELLGSSIQDLREQRDFSIKTIAMIGVQLISALEALHAAGVVHRDVKPENIAISTKINDPKMYLLDLGAAEKFLNNGVHIKYEETKAFIGDQTFHSVAVMQGVLSSRRDDMESLGYVLVYLARKTLPWSEINSRNYRTRQEQVKFKLGMKTSALCKGLESEYQRYLDYCRKLHFDEKPNYSYLRTLLMNIAVRFGFTGSWDYDWVEKCATEKTNQSSSDCTKCKSLKCSRLSISRMMRELATAEVSPGQIMETLKQGNRAKGFLNLRAVSPVTPATADSTQTIEKVGLEYEFQGKKQLNLTEEESEFDVSECTPRRVYSGNIDFVRRMLKNLDQ